MSIFSTAFLDTLTSNEATTLVNFHAAATQVRRPIVRRSCKEAGFVRKAEEMKNDPIFLAFKKWIQWAVDNSPTTGLVVGDTWMDWVREYQRQPSNPRIFFVVDPVVPENDSIVGGSLHVKGELVDYLMSVPDMVVFRKIASQEIGCLILDLEMLLLSLEFPELDGIPVLHQVLSIHDDRMTVESMLTHGKSNYSYWPLVGSVPTFVEGKLAFEDACVGQLIALLQFRIAPRHPMKGYKGCASHDKSANWALQEGTWKTTLYFDSQPALKKRMRQPDVIAVSSDDDE